MPRLQRTGALKADLDAWSTGDATARDVQATRSVQAVVVALVPEFRQVQVRDNDGHTYSLTQKTSGVHLEDLREGQRLACVVTTRLPRVLSAMALA